MKFAAKVVAASSALACAAWAGDLPPNVARYGAADLDGVWSGGGTVSGSSNCVSPSMKFVVKGGRIFMDGMTHGAFWQSGSSKVFGVVHQDKSVELTLVDRNGRGRTSQTFGQIDPQSGEMLVNDKGTNCSYVYKLKRG
jgi:hypothetical protein